MRSAPKTIYSLNEPFLTSDRCRKFLFVSVNNNEAEVSQPSETVEKGLRGDGVADGWRRRAPQDALVSGRRHLPGEQLEVIGRSRHGELLSSS